MVIKILGGYEISIKAENTHEIFCVKKEGREVKFAFKFYERNKDYLDTFSNIENFIKRPQDREKQDRVSIDLVSQRTNTTNSEKLLLASSLLLNKIGDSVDSEILKAIIKTAKEKITNFDKVLLDLKTEQTKLENMKQSLIEIFGAENSAVAQADEKLVSIFEKIKEREQELLNI